MQVNNGGKKVQIEMKKKEKENVCESSIHSIPGCLCSRCESEILLRYKSNLAGHPMGTFLA